MTQTARRLAPRASTRPSRFRLARTFLPPGFADAALMRIVDRICALASPEPVASSVQIHEFVHADGERPHRRASHRHALRPAAPRHHPPRETSCVCRVVDVVLRARLLDDALGPAVERAKGKRIPWRSSPPSGGRRAAFLSVCATESFSSPGIVGSKAPKKMPMVAPRKPPMTVASTVFTAQLFMKSSSAICSGWASRSSCTSWAPPPGASSWAPLPGRHPRWTPPRGGCVQGGRLGGSSAPASSIIAARLRRRRYRVPPPTRTSDAAGRSTGPRASADAAPAADGPPRTPPCASACEESPSPLAVLRRARSAASARAR